MIRRLLRRPLAALVLLALLVPAGRALAAFTYSVVRGDSLWTIGQRHGTTVEDLRSANALPSDTIYPGQTLTIPDRADAPPEPTPSYMAYTVKPGDTLWLIAGRHGTTVDAIIRENKLTSTTIYPGQVLTVPGSQPSGLPPAPQPAAPATYEVQRGDSLWLIATGFDTTVSALKAANGLASDVIYPGQVLVLPGNRPASPPSRSPSPPQPPPGELVAACFVYPVGFRLHHVEAGETLGRISSVYGTPIEVIKATNRLLTDLLQIGQPVFVQAGGTSPGLVTVTQGPHGAGGAELLDWEHARWLFGGQRQAIIRDPVSGMQFRVRRLGGGNHADCEPLTKEDTRIMKAIAGGEWTWTPKPVHVLVDGRAIAASINFMPHSIQTITTNGFSGHFCVHFRHSRTHNTDSEDPHHQANILEAAGLKGVDLPPGM